jgi:hypothetical protein
MLEAALSYLMDGRPIFPVCTPVAPGRCLQHGKCQDGSKSRAGKVPLVPWRKYQTELPSEQEVIDWWSKRWPQANIGMATGSLSGVAVLDVDDLAARKQAFQSGGLDSTPTVFTGKAGGTHFHLKWPGYEVKNFARKMPGLDFRGDGGYVLLPPSRHELGAQYRWAEGTFPLAPSPLPRWLTDLFTGSTANDDPFEQEQRHEPLDLGAILDGIPAGERDDKLFRYACKLRGDNVPLAYAEVLVRQAARACRPPFDESLAAEKVRRVYREYAAPVVLDVPAAPKAGADPFPSEPEEAWQWPVYDAADFLQMAFPQVDWIVGGFIKEQAIVFDFGPPGAFKTILLAQLSVCIAMGLPFLGQYPVKRGKVLIVQEDTLEDDFQTYLRNIVRALGVDPEELRTWLHIAPPADMKLDRSERLAAFDAWMAEHTPALVAMDAFYLFHDSDGMTAKDLNPILRSLKWLRRRHNNAFWMLDHDRKTGKEGNGEGNPIDRMYGGRPKSAACDAIVESQPIKGDKMSAYLMVHKLRGARPPEPMRLRLDDGLLIADGGSAETASGVTETLYQWLIREGGSRTKRAMAAGTGVTTRSIETAIAELTTRGLAQEMARTGREKTWMGIRQAPAATRETTLEL